MAKTTSKATAARVPGFEHSLYQVFRSDWDTVKPWRVQGRFGCAGFRYKKDAEEFARVFRSAVAEVAK
jgi:hypothetical protein